MKVKVNKDACMGCGACTANCPDVFEYNDEGYAVAKVTEVPEELKAQVNDAKDGCPVEAIEVEE